MRPRSRSRRAPLDPPVATPPAATSVPLPTTYLPLLRPALPSFPTVTADDLIDEEEEDDLPPCHDRHDSVGSLSPMEDVVDESEDDYSRAPQQQRHPPDYSAGRGVPPAQNHVTTSLVPGNLSLPFIQSATSNQQNRTNCSPDGQLDGGLGPAGESFAAGPAPSPRGETTHEDELETTHEDHHEAPTPLNDIHVDGLCFAQAVTPTGYVKHFPPPPAEEGREDEEPVPVHGEESFCSAEEPEGAEELLGLTEDEAEDEPMFEEVEDNVEREKVLGAGEQEGEQGVVGGSFGADAEEGVLAEGPEEGGGVEEEFLPGVEMKVMLGGVEEDRAPVEQEDVGAALGEHAGGVDEMEVENHALGAEAENHALVLDESIHPGDEDPLGAEAMEDGKQEKIAGGEEMECVEEEEWVEEEECVEEEEWVEEEECAVEEEECAVEEEACAVEEEACAVVEGEDAEEGDEFIAEFGEDAEELEYEGAEEIEYEGGEELEGAEELQYEAAEDEGAEEIEAAEEIEEESDAELDLPSDGEIRTDDEEEVAPESLEG